MITSSPSRAPQQVFRVPSGIMLLFGFLLTGCGEPSDLHIAAGSGDLRSVQKHLMAGAAVNAKDRRGWIPSHQDSARKKRSGGWTPLHFAAFGGHKETVQFLIKSNADVGARDQHGTTSLHYVVVGGYTTTAELLIAKGSDVNATDTAGMTPLDFAITYNKSQSATINLLREHGGKRGKELRAEAN